MRSTKFFIFSILILGLVSFTSCEEDPVDATPNILTLAEDTPELSSLVAALERANLTSAFTAAGSKTLFAPTNTAFQKLLDSNPNWNSLTDIDVTTLTNVLLFHVIDGANIKAADLSNTYVNTLSTGPNGEAISIQVDVSNGVVFNGVAKPEMTDIAASNGIVHTIDEVMLPPNVVTLALNNSDFSNLVAALTRDDLTADFVSVLSGNGPFTIFAPTNKAFTDLLDSNSEWTTLTDIPVATLEAVLNYHVVNAANVQSDELSDNQGITSLGGELVVDLSNGAKLETSSNQSVTIALTDVQGTNGVIHVVDQVLIP